MCWAAVYTRRCCALLNVHAYEKRYFESTIVALVSRVLTYVPHKVHC